MHGQRPTSGRRLRMLVLPLATTVIAAGAVWRVSAATFADAGAGAGSRPQAVLTNDAEGTPLFAGGPIVPGDSGTRCIAVTSSHGQAGELRMYLTGATATPVALDQHLFLTVEQGNGGDATSCTGFLPVGPPIIDRQSLATAAATYHDFGTGAGPWSTTGTAGETVTYRITWSFDTTGMSQAAENELMGQASSIGWQWELHDR